MDHFGEHLMIDIYEIRDKFLNNRKILKDLFNSIIHKTSMHPLSEIAILDVEEEENSQKDFWWLSAFQIIKESHISIHTFVGIWFASMDIYTCKKIKDIDVILKIIKDIFNTEKIEVNFIKRWINYNKYLQTFLKKRER